MKLFILKLLIALLKFKVRNMKSYINGIKLPNFCLEQCFGFIKNNLLDARQLFILSIFITECHQSTEFQALKTYSDFVFIFMTLLFLFFIFY